VRASETPGSPPLPPPRAIDSPCYSALRFGHLLSESPTRVSFNSPPRAKVHEIFAGLKFWWLSPSPFAVPLLPAPLLFYLFLSGGLSPSVRSELGCARMALTGHGPPR